VDLGRKVKSQFYCDINFFNTIPPVPFEPKLVKVNPATFGAEYSSYAGSAIEQAIIPDTIPDPFLGMNLSLVDADRYRWQSHAQGEKVLASEDTALLSTDMQSEAVRRYGESVLDLRKVDASVARRSGYVSEIVLQKFLTTPLYSESQIESWARRRQAEQSFASQQAQSDTAAKDDPYAGLNAKEIAIKSFELAKVTPVHPKNPKLKPIEVIDILPRPDLLNSSLTWIGFRRLDDALLPGVGIDIRAIEQIKGAYKPTEEDNQHTLEALCDAVLQEHGSENGVEGFGLYQAQDAAILLGEKRTAESAGIEREGPEVKLNSKRRFNWVRECELAPGTAVEPDNNYILILQTDQATGKSTAHYARYQRRFVLRKRVATRREGAVDEIKSRPAVIEAVGAPMLEAGVRAP